MEHRPEPRITRRSRRLTDAETRERMLRTAIDMISRDGLTVSLDHISFEAVIRAADVSRSTAYRHWQFKEQFIGDVVTELARGAVPPVLHAEIGLIRQIVDEHADWLATAETRHALVVELIRRLTRHDLRAVLASPAWRTYHALCATTNGLEGDLGDRVRAALAESEQARITRVATAWRTLAETFGYRLRPELNAGFETLAAILGVTMHGLVVTETAAPQIAGRETVAAPFGAHAEERWSLAALGFAATAMTFLEPDPDAHWDEAVLRNTLDTWAVNSTA
ncbi:TetR/AcrR family transcriptional regulator [Actinoplanes sp. G11-F43]|uniref:TetR/AcrR family transcriptional regulator n=1 Tax=Actinoplanes sp. G11-F43 TaxID=3424130 RepID=UPI003D3266D2